MRKRKKVKIAKTTNLVDRLGDLPDSIIHHVFSFLDMKLVVQTSTLATRWRNLWASTPYLNFKFKLSSPSKDEKRGFMRFVDLVLICRDAFAIHKFKLPSKSVLDVWHLHTWLIGALKRNVKELHFNSGVDEAFALPPCVFTSDIVVLTLSVGFGRGAMLLPSTICSAVKLRTLKLVCVNLPDGNSDGELILSFPILESLSMLYCYDKHLKVLKISAIVLNTFKFSNDVLSDSSCYLNICCPNLTSIMYTCYGRPNVSTMKYPALVSANIQICRYVTDINEDYKNWLIRFVRGICNVRSLTLGGYTLWDMTSSPTILQELPSLFTNLRGIRVEDFDDDEGWTSIWAMANIMNMFPSIQTLVWDRTEPEEGQYSDDEELPVPVILHGLETVEIRNPFGFRDELKFIKFLLEGAISLNEMTVKLTLKKRYSKRFRKKLLAFPRASTEALVHCPSGAEARQS